MEISLQELAGGALQEKVNQAFEKVMQNMQDPNTPWKNKRKITVGITFAQNEDRTDCTCDISVDTKLAAVKPVSTKFCTQKDLATGFMPRNMDRESEDRCLSRMWIKTW